MSTDLYPRHAAAYVDSLDETRVAVSDIACDVRRRYRGRPSGRSAEQASAGSTVPADAASAGFASVRRRHEPSLDVCASARSDGGGGRQRQEGNDRSDAERLSARGMLRRVRTALRGTMQSCSTGWSGDLRVHEANGTRAVSRNAANPVRIGLQHARTPRAEQTVEVVEIHEDGTRCAAGGAGTPKEGGNTDREWTLKGLDRRQGKRGRNPGEADQETDPG